jgi:hypothetical protein
MRPLKTAKSSARGMRALFVANRRGAQPAGLQPLRIFEVREVDSRIEVRTEA